MSEDDQQNAEWPPMLGVIDVRHKCRALKNQTPAVTDAMVWQPIATAPKTNGRVVLLHCEQNGIALAYYSMAGWTPVAWGEIVFDHYGIVARPEDLNPKWWMRIQSPKGTIGDFDV